MIVDVHAHVMPEAFLQGLQVAAGQHDIVVRQRSRSGWEMAFQEKYREITPAFYDYKGRLQVMDEMGVDVEVLSLAANPHVYWAPPDLALELSRVTNDSIAEAVQAFPDRFVGLASLPMQSPDMAVAELHRAITTRGLSGVFLLSSAPGLEPDSRELDPFYRAVSSLGVPLFIHPPEPPAVGRVGSYFLNNLLGNTFETTVTLGRLIYGGVFDRHPDLKCLFAHGGGYFALALGRLDKGWESREECNQAIPKRPSEYVHHIFVDSVVNSSAALRFIIDIVGSDHIMVGTDFPFHMGDRTPQETVDGIPRLTGADKRRILSANALALFNWQ